MTTWSVPAPAPRVWEVLADPGFTWPVWWPGLRSESAGVVAGPDGLGGAGSWVRLRVRSPVGGALDLRLDLVEARAPDPERSGRAKLRVSGDLRGGASVSVAERPEGHSEIRLTWVVTPVRGRPALAARVAPALCIWAHSRVMRAGERGLARHLA
ncbi:SRPBCC family protein [Myceligenerans halotolerans]